MAKLTARAIERMLEAKGVAEVPNPPYLVSARAMFAQLVVDSLTQARLHASWRKTAPPSLTHLDEAQVDEIVRNSGPFLNAFWHAQRTGSHRGRINVLGGGNVSWNAGGEVSISFDGSVIGGTKGRMASTIRKGPVTARRLSPDQVDVAYDRLPALIARAQEILEDAMDRPFPLTLEEGRRGPWGYVCVRGEVDGRDVRLILWGVTALAHRSDEDLLHAVGYVPHEIFEGGRRKARFLSRVPDIQDRLDAIVSTTGLPIGVTIAQDTDRADHKEDRDDVWLVLRGYGPGGLAQLRDVSTIGSKDASIDTLRSRLSKAIDEQHRLHALHGPLPGSDVVEWRMDAATLSCGVTAEQVERCIRTGASPVREGASIRLSGKRILGQVEVAQGMLWRGDQLRAVGISVPDSIMSALVGREVHDVVDAPMLRNAGVITSAKADTVHKKVRLTLKVRPRMAPVPETAA